LGQRKVPMVRWWHNTSQTLLAVVKIEGKPKEIGYTGKYTCRVVAIVDTGLLIGCDKNQKLSGIFRADCVIR